MGIDSFEKIIQEDYKVFVDTSSLMQPESEVVFFKLIAPLLHKYDKKLILPQSVLNEVENHNKNNHKDIFRANNILTELANHGLYGKSSKFNESFADNAIAAQFLELRLKYNLCLITNDNSHKKDGNLSEDIINLKKSRSVDNIKDIRVFYIKNQTLFEYKSKSSHKNLGNKQYDAKVNTFQFKLPIVPSTDDFNLTVSNMPTINDFVLDNNGNQHKLIKQIGRTGGEGSVYLTDTNYACKIYKKEKITKFKENKIQLLIENSIKVQNVCLPELIAYNNCKEFIGYLMPQAQGTEIKTSIFTPPLFKKKFPQWNRQHLAKVSLNILKKIEELHRYNIILGDINPSNILLEDENNIHFIDTDSFQIENYPCSVGMVPYTRREHHGKEYRTYLRTKDDDIFAVSTLIFQIMLPGKLPYSFSGGGSEKENMKPENFPYKCDDSGYKNAPDGQWVYIWSHLPYKLKRIFCRTFKNNEIVPLSEFIEQMNSYIFQLEQGHQSQEIFPLLHKQIDNNGNVKHDDFKKFVCKICNSEFALSNNKIEEFARKGKRLPTKCDICKDIPDIDLKTCVTCNAKFKDETHTHCKKCRGVYIWCTSCNNRFFFSDSQKEFYDKKGLSYPKKCEYCRKNNNTKKTHFGHGSASGQQRHSNSGGIVSAFLNFIFK